MANPIYDVVVVGSGASGGTLAAHLARAGAHVAMVEGGPKINTRTDFPTHAMPWEFSNRQIPKMRPGKPGISGIGFESDPKLTNLRCIKNCKVFGAVRVPK